MHTLTTAILRDGLEGQRKGRGEKCNLFFTVASVLPISFKREISYSF